MPDASQTDLSASSIAGKMLTFFFGGGIVALAEVIRRAYTTRMKREEHGDTLQDKREAREADDSRAFVHEANAERRATLERVDRQAAEITRLSVEIAKCTAKHELMEERDAEKEKQIQQLTVALDMTSQLVTRQREEIAAQELVIESQGRDLVSLHIELTGLKASFDAFVQKTILETPQQ